MYREPIAGRMLSRLLYRLEAELHSGNSEGAMKTYRLIEELVGHDYSRLLISLDIDAAKTVAAGWDGKSAPESRN